MIPQKMKLKVSSFKILSLATVVLFLFSGISYSVLAGVISGKGQITVTSSGLNIGDWVEVYNTGSWGLIAWKDSSCVNRYTSDKNRFDGDKGKIIEGPVYSSCDGHNRWKIQWQRDGLIGWSSVGYLRKTSEPAAPTSVKELEIENSNSSFALTIKQGETAEATIRIKNPNSASYYLKKGSFRITDWAGFKGSISASEIDNSDVAINGNSAREIKLKIEAKDSPAGTYYPRYELQSNI